MEESNSDAKLEESETIEKEKILLKRSWSFWENYESKNRAEKDYSKLLKEIYTFHDIISFWQFWNKYPGNDTKQIFYNGDHVKYFFKEKYRIIAMNVFEEGIKPEWEDKKNQKGNVLTLEYIVDTGLDIFLPKVTELWKKLLLYLIGETLPYSDNINGIRFCDKTKFGYNKSVIFKFELWVSSLMKEEELEELKKYLITEFGCSATIKPIK
jgi:hypothetical protein